METLGSSPTEYDGAPAELCSERPIRPAVATGRSQEELVEAVGWQHGEGWQDSLLAHFAGRGVDHGVPEGPFTKEQAAQLEEQDRRQEKRWARLRFVDGEPLEAQLYKRAAIIGESDPAAHVRAGLLRPRAHGAVRGRLTHARPRASRGRSVRVRGSRRMASSRAGPGSDDDLPDDPEPPGLRLWRRPRFDSCTSNLIGEGV